MKTLRLQSIFARVTACMVCLALSLTMIPSASAAQTATAPSWIDKSEYVTFSDGAAYQSDMWNTITTLRNYAQSGGEAPAYGKTYYKECETLSRSTSPVRVRTDQTEVCSQCRGQGESCPLQHCF